MLTDRKLKPLSVVPYYGGKYNMAYLIADMLPYEGYDIYVEPFGGGGRVLLNKARHKEEYYGELTEGISTMFYVLSKPETADKFIHCLFDTEISEKFFDECKLYKNYIEDDYFTFKLDMVLDKLKDIGKGKVILKNSFVRALGKLLSKEYYEKYIQKCMPNEVYQDKDIELMAKVFDEFKDLYKEYKIEQEDIVYLNNTINLLTEMIIVTYRYIYQKDIIIDDSNTDGNEKRRFTCVRNEIYNAIDDSDNSYIDKDIFPNLAKIDDYDIRIAVATYVVYTQSRNALGIKWKENKFKSKDDYERHIALLTEVAKRLDGVSVYRSFPAEIFFAKAKGIPVEYLDNWIDFINYPNACMYLDPTYLKSANVERDNYNPGILYKRYYDTNDHINLLKFIQLAKCYIIISNYDDEEHLYARYLENGEGLSGEELKHFKPFKRYELKVKSTLNPKNPVDRVECLWYREGIK